MTTQRMLTQLEGQLGLLLLSHEKSSFLSFFCGGNNFFNRRKKNHFLAIMFFESFLIFFLTRKQNFHKELVFILISSSNLFALSKQKKNVLWAQQEFANDPKIKQIPMKECWFGLEYCFQHFLRYFMLLSVFEL